MVLNLDEGRVSLFLSHAAKADGSGVLPPIIFNVQGRSTVLNLEIKPQPIVILVLEFADLARVFNVHAVKSFHHCELTT